VEEIIDEILRHINLLKLHNTLIIVEGIKDKRALNELGITNILTLSRKPLFSVVEDVVKNTTEVAILTDLDEKGKQLYSRLTKDLQRHGIKVDDQLRRLLFKARLSHIEGLNSFISKHL